VGIGEPRAIPSALCGKQRIRTTLLRARAILVGLQPALVGGHPLLTGKIAAELTPSVSDFASDVGSPRATTQRTRRRHRGATAHTAAVTATSSAAAALRQRSAADRERNTPKGKKNFLTHIGFLLKTTN